MKEVVTPQRVTLIAENNSDRVALQHTPYDTLRQQYNIPKNKQLALDYNDGQPKSVQYYLEDGGYTVKDE